MHAIKKAARREAWYGNGDPTNKTYNFFGRLDTRPRKPQDEERGLQHVMSEGDAPSPIEEARRRNVADTTGPYSGPRKAGTFPAGPALNMPLTRERGDVTSEVTSKESSEKPESTSQSAGPVGVVDESAGPRQGDSGPRKRKLRKFMLCASKDDDGDANGLERTETGNSKKKKNKKFPDLKLTFMGQVKAVFGSWVNILLVATPVGIALEYANVNKIIVFVVNFIAIIPLAGMLSFATEELAMYIGETLGGLLNATFGNAVELIVGVIALSQGQILIVQTSLIGSMLSNLLLVMGMCFFFGGLKRQEQFFNITVAQTAASLLALAIGSLIIPTAFQIFATIDTGVTPSSRGTAVMLLFVYGCYLLFQLKTHNDMYNEPSKKVPKRQSGKKGQGDMSRGLAMMGAGAGAAASGGGVNQENLVHDEADEGETPQLTVIGALVTLAGATVLIALCAEFMVSAIGAVAKTVSPEFIGLILLPIVGNAAEHATAVTVAIKDKMDLAIGVAVGSSLQIALLVLPIMVLLSWWGVGKPAEMTLDFDGFQVAVLFIAIVLVNYLIQDGKSHWLEGIMLQILYLIIALHAWFYPASPDVVG